MLNITKAIISPKTLGRKQLLVEVLPIYLYDGGKRSETITGYRYTVVLPDCEFEKIGIKIDGDQQLEKPIDTMEVAFENLELYIYWYNGTYQLGARATAIKVKA